MSIVRLTESSNVQSLPTLGVSLTIRGGEAWTRATLATKGMVHFIFGGGVGEGSKFFVLEKVGWWGGGFSFSNMGWWYLCSGVRERDQIR